MNEVEVFRARNKIYNTLLNFQSSQEISSKIANQLLYFGRRIPRSEVAQRISHFDSHLLNRVAKEWFYDRVSPRLFSLCGHRISLSLLGDLSTP
jgi:processing peptidase subunit beta